MKRDMDLCRTILMELQDKEKPAGWIDLSIPGHSEEEISQHVRLLAEAGLIDAQDLTAMNAFMWKPKRLTWAGHEFLDAARNDGIWRRAKSFVIENTGTLTLELLKAALSEVTKGALSGKLIPP